MQKAIQNYLDILGVSEKDLLNDLRGYYKPSFFYIYLKGSFNTDIDLLSIKDRGTFIHEYIHYIQNIATYWGLYTSIVRYQELTEFKSHLIVSNDLEIPLIIDYSENLKRKIDRVKLGNGSLSFSNDRPWNINRSQEIAIEKSVVNLHGKNTDNIELTIKFDDDRIEKIDLGAHIIKESMAAMYQSLVDANADAEHKDVPYNLIKILCDQHFPNISNDTEKLICICYTSLFSMSPGSELISLLERASAEPDMDGMSIFSEFVNTKVIVDKDGNRYNIVDYFDALVNGFKQSLDTNLQAELDYIDKVLERIRLSNNAVPYLTILYDPDKLSVDNMNAIVGYFGIPYIQTNNGYHFPQSTKERASKDESSVDVLELVAQEAMFSYMTRPRDKVCPLYYMCSGSEYDKIGCIGAPWDEPLCSFTIVSSPFSLSKKTIIWRF